jgi:hypothetical protein
MGGDNELFNGRIRDDNLVPNISIIFWRIVPTKV